MRTGFVKRYKGCEIYYKGWCFAVTDKNGLTIFETESGFPSEILIVEDWIDENTTDGKLNDNIQK